MANLSEWIAIILVVAGGIYFIAIASETFRLARNPQADKDEIRNANLLLLAVLIIFVLITLQVYNVLYSDSTNGADYLKQKLEVEL